MIAPSIAVVDRTGVLRDAVRSVRLALDGPPEVHDVRRHSDFDVGGVVADVLVLGTRELTGAGLKRAQRWAAEHPDGRIVAQLPPLGSAAPTAEVLRANGVQAWFRGEPTEQRLVPLLRDALPSPRQPEPEADASPDADPEADVEAVVEREPAPLVTVCSATGGCGKTFLATNLAAAAAAQGRRVLVVDLDLQFGEVGAALQTRHPHSIYDGLYDAAGDPLPDEALEEHLAELVDSSPLGFDVLLAPRDPAVADLITADDVTHVLTTVADHYDLVLVDTPPVLDDVVLAALDLSTTVAVIATLDVPSLRNLTTYLEVLEQIGVGQDRVRLLLNKVESDIGIDPGQAQEVFGGRFVAELPADKAASRSINTGTVVLRSEPRTSLAKALLAAADVVLPAPAPVAGAPEHAPAALRTGRWRALFRMPRPTPGGTT